METEKLVAAVQSLGAIFAGNTVSLLLKLVLLVSIPLGIWIVYRMAKSFLHSVRRSEADKASEKYEQEDTNKAHDENANQNNQAVIDSAASDAAKWAIGHRASKTPKIE